MVRNHSPREMQRVNGGMHLNGAMAFKLDARLQGRLTYTPFDTCPALRESRYAHSRRAGN